jgi:acetoin utilization deacetylase AcuC-like enzyme
MKLIYSSECLDYEEPGHAESPERLRCAYNFLKDKYLTIEARPASDIELLKIHSERHLQSVQNYLDYHPDCPPYPNIDKYARLAAGAAIQANQQNGFSLMRPPGHHAGRERLAGFCYYNNIAVAVKSTSKKTLIIDFDGHHGDGTQSIFLGDEQVVFVSLHRFPWYPGTGLRHQVNCFNFPLSALCGDVVYLQTLDAALEEIKLDRIEQIAVSAGFDAFADDALASLSLSTDSFYEIGQRIRKLSLPTFAVLEGGYVAESLGVNIHAFLQGLSN